MLLADGDKVGRVGEKKQVQAAPRLLRVELDHGKLTSTYKKALEPGSNSLPLSIMTPQLSVLR